MVERGRPIDGGAGGQVPAWLIILATLIVILTFAAALAGVSPGPLGLAGIVGALTGLLSAIAGAAWISRREDQDG